jgi:diguanylate cyclase (GGDEF)-like protein
LDEYSYTTRGLSLSTARASPRQIAVAMLAGVVSLALFVGIAPFATHPLAKLPAFLSSCEIVLIFCDILTAILIFQQYTFFRSPSMLVLASAYVFSSAMASCHIMTFPGVFVANGLLGAGAQSSVWIYMSWHASFPLLLTAYATVSLKEMRAAAAEPKTAPAIDRAGVRILLCVLAAVGVAAAQAALAIHWKDHLPQLILQGRFLPLMKVLSLIAGALCLIAIGALLRGGGITVLRLWLIVTMGVWILDLLMTNAISGGRYDLGWFAGKIFGLLAGCTIFVLYVLENTRNYQRLARLTEALQKLSQNDGLTGLANRRALDDYLARQLELSRRREDKLSLVMCDVDYFKRFNDNYGHLAGDQCLILVSEALQSCCRRKSDMVARYGGEEFALILPGTGIESALQAAESAREAVLALRIPHAFSETAPFVTISVGVAEASERDGARTSPLALIAASDRALFAAKAQGRNRVIKAGPDVLGPA